MKTNWFNHLFFTIGVLFISVLIHEFIHYLQCGGDFIAGFYWIKSEWGFGVTYCKSGNASELLAYSISYLFLTVIFFMKLKINKGNF